MPASKQVDDGPDVELLHTCGMIICHKLVRRRPAFISCMRNNIPELCFKPPATAPPLTKILIFGLINCTK